MTSQSTVPPCLQHKSRRKANMINTFEYFNLLLAAIPHHMNDKNFRFIDDLLLWSSSVHKNAPTDTKSLDFSICLNLILGLQYALIRNLSIFYSSALLISGFNND